MNSSWSRNYNMVRHESRAMGPIVLTFMLAVSVALVGLVAATQGAKATSYDYAISSMENEISELTSKKEDLAVEKARLTSIAASETSEVAANMEGAQVADYANE